MGVNTTYGLNTRYKKEDVHNSTCLSVDSKTKKVSENSAVASKNISAAATMSLVEILKKF